MKRTSNKSTEIEVLDGGVEPMERLYRFRVCKVLGRDGDGFQVEARGERGSVVTSVFGNVDVRSVVGAVFWRS